MSLVENRKAHFNFEILEKFDAGIELVGHEVKAVKNGKASLEGSFVIVRGKEVYLMGATIQPYQMSNTPEGYDTLRVRKLLVTKKELAKLAEMGEKKGLTLVPLSMYNKGRFVKLSFALARGKKNFDKRETIKKRENERELGREFKAR